MTRRSSVAASGGQRRARAGRPLGVTRLVGAGTRV